MPYVRYSWEQFLVNALLAKSDLKQAKIARAESRLSGRVAVLIDQSYADNRLDWFKWFDEFLSIQDGLKSLEWLKRS